MTPLHHLLYKEAAETAETGIKTKQKQKQQVERGHGPGTDRLLQKSPLLHSQLSFVK
jgi:hypothetical protein